MSEFTVLLEDGTIGQASSIHDDIVGELWTVELQDENGNKIQKTGTIKEVLA
jgi:hypothetical protein